VEQPILSDLEFVICDAVTSLASVTLDELIQRLPDYSWAQVFAAVDRLSRDGTLRLSHANRFGFAISTGPHLLQSLSWRDQNRHALLRGSSTVSTHPKEGIANVGSLSTREGKAECEARFTHEEEAEQWPVR